MAGFMKKKSFGNKVWTNIIPSEENLKFYYKWSMSLQKG